PRLDAFLPRAGRRREPANLISSKASMPPLEAYKPSLLVSVRSEAEVEVALAGGAALIDVKEPARGSLGRASEATLTGVLRSVAGRRPVSAALGELAEATENRWPLAAIGLAYVKWGLAGYADVKRDWRRDLAGEAT